MSVRTFLDHWSRNRAVLVTVMVLTYSAQSLIITSSQDRSGGFAYDTTSVVFLVESIKLVFSTAMLEPAARRRLFGIQKGSSGEQKRSLFNALKEGVPFAVPALLYAVQNQLVFEALKFITPPEYQLLNNMKLFTTSIVYRIVMKREIRVVQWIALLQLAIGMALASTREQARGESLGNTEFVATQPVSFIDLRGVAIMFAVSWSSAGAGVMNEWLIKRSLNPHEASFWLYLIGSLMCGFQLGASGWARLLRLEGFTASTWLVVVCNAVLGQTIGFLFRYANTIVKLYAVCGAMGFTVFVSALFLGVGVPPLALPGYVLVAISMCLFYGSPEVLNATDSQIWARLFESKCGDTAGINHAKSS